MPFSLVFLLLLLGVVIGHVTANTEKLIVTVDEAIVQCPLSLRHSSAPLHPTAVLSPPYTVWHDTVVGLTQHQQHNSMPFQHLYQLRHLVWGHSYEVKVSYPATTPTDFYLEIMANCTTTESSEYWLSLRAVHTGISKYPIPPTVQYSIVLETLYAGVLFYQVSKIVTAVIAVLVLGKCLAIPFVRQRVLHSIGVSTFLMEKK